MLTPFATARLSGYGRVRRLGTRFVAWLENLDVELSGERRESALAAPEHGARIDFLRPGMPTVRHPDPRRIPRFSGQIPAVRAPDPDGAYVLPSS